MKKVHLLLRRTVVGRVELYAGAPAGPDDFRCEPPGILPLEAVQDIARGIAEGGTGGVAERYRWRLDRQPG